MAREPLTAPVLIDPLVVEPRSSDFQLSCTHRHSARSRVSSFLVRVETAAPASSSYAYRPRHPERTVLYRALAQHFERFLLLYEKRFQRSQKVHKRWAGKTTMSSPEALG